MSEESPFTHQQVFKGIGLSAFATLLILFGVVFLKNSPAKNPLSWIRGEQQKIPITERVISESRDNSPEIDQQVLGTSEVEKSEDKITDSEPNNFSETDKFVDISKLYLLINAHRREKDLSPLLINAQLEYSARLKLQDMIDQKYYRHQDTSGTESWYLFNQAGYQYSLAGENLSFNNNTAWQVFSNWLASPKHEEQLSEPDYIDMGLAVDCETFVELADGGCIVVLHLGSD